MLETTLGTAIGGLLLAAVIAVIHHVWHSLIHWRERGRRAKANVATVMLYDDDPAPVPAQRSSVGEAIDSLGGPGEIGEALRSLGM